METHDCLLAVTYSTSRSVSELLETEIYKVHQNTFDIFCENTN